jgi:hypothetical protein
MRKLNVKLPNIKIEMPIAGILRRKKRREEEEIIMSIHNETNETKKSDEDFIVGCYQNRSDQRNKIERYRIVKYSDVKHIVLNEKGCFELGYLNEFPTGLSNLYITIEVCNGNSAYEKIKNKLWSNHGYKSDD